MKIILVSLLIVVSGFCSLQAQNLLSNPGFEEGLETWNYGTWGGALANFDAVSDIFQEGSKAAKVEVTAAYPEDGGRAFIRKNGLKIEKDVPHRLRFHLLSNSGNTESIVVSMYSHTNIGSTGWGSAYSNTNIEFEGDGKWHRIALDFTPTNLGGEPDFNALGLLFGFAKNASTIYMDSVSLVSEGKGLSNNIHVSVYGNDNNDGSLEAPFKTITKAAEIASAGDTVFIHKGTYPETVVPAKSGLPGFPVVYQSFNNEKVVISAMEALTNWQQDQGNIYKTQVNWDLGQANFVMHDTTVLDLARWPNNSDGNLFTPNSKRNSGGSGGDMVSNAYLNSTEIPAYDWSKGGSIWFYGDKPGAGWTAWKAFIKSSSSGKVSFDLDKSPTWIRTVHPPGDKGDFFLEGIKEALDFQNEWYFDEGTKTLYVQLPGGGKPGDNKVQMRKRELAFDLQGKSYIEIKNLAVFGGSIEINGSGNKLSGVSSFYGNYTRGVVSGFRANAQSIYIKSGTGNIIEKCEIAFGSGSGIWDQGTQTTILDCYIHDFNFLGFYDSPINGRGTGTTVQSNTISRGGRDALQIMAENSVVAYNDISFSNLIADDCGLFYTLGLDKNMEIHHNWFHDAHSRGSLYKAAGIYLDNNSGGFKVHHNVVWNTEWSSIQINLDGVNIDIFNNTFWNGSAAMGAWHKDGTKFTNVKVWNNLSDDSNWEEQADKQNNLSVSINPFVNSQEGDFFLKNGSQPIDKGKIIDGITDGFVGAAPDVGAYENGGENWKPGITWNTAIGPVGANCYGLPGENCNENLTDIQDYFKNELLVYPNPVSGNNLNVEFPKANQDINWTIYSINGTLIKSGQNQFERHFKIDISGVKTGMFILKINTKTENFNRKIIKN